MKYLMAGILLFTIVSLCPAAVTVDQIVKLSQLKTSDEVIIGLIEKQGMEKPVTSADVVTLKEQGVSDAVIQRLLKESTAPAMEERNIRTYYTTGKNGRRVQVATNLDENGKRMGPPPLPPYEPVWPKYVEPPPPQQINVTVQNEEPPPPEEPQDYEEPNGIPYYPYDPYISYGGYPIAPGEGMYGGHGGFGHHGHHPAGIFRPPLVRPSAIPRFSPHSVAARGVSRSSSAGMAIVRPTR